MVHLLFATPLGLAASLRLDGFVSGAMSFVRRTLAKGAFLGFQIGVQRSKSVRFSCFFFFSFFMVFLLDSKGAKVCPNDACVIFVDLVKSFQTSVY